MNYLRSNFQQFKPASNLAFNERLKEMQLNGKKVYNLAFGQSPFPVPDIGVKALRENAGDAEYVAVKGLREAREAISKYHERLDGIKNIDPDNIIVGPGTKTLIYFLMQVVNGDIFIEGPSWTTYKPQTHLSNHNCHVITTSIQEKWKITPKLLQETFSKHADNDKMNVLIFCNPDNPTGTSYSEQELKDISEVIKRYNVVVLSDEIYGRLSYYGNHISICRYLPEQTIVSSGISKWASAGGWRMGYHIYPAKLRPILNAVESLASNTYSCASVPIQRAAIALMEDDASIQNYVQHCSRILKTVAECACKKLDNVGVNVVQPQSGYYIAPDFEVIRPQLIKRGITTGKEMCSAILEESSVAMMACGTDYQMDADSLVTRLCYINFDGTRAIEESKNIGLENTLDEDFVKRMCGPTYAALVAITAWVETQKSNYST